MTDELYHASENPDIEALEPRAIGKRDPQDNARVYATDDEAYASMFLVKSDDSWTFKFGLEDEGLEAHWFICISDKDRYLEKDKGGIIYSLPKEQFIPVPDCSTPEWISLQPVNITGKKFYASGIDAMLKHNVQVYFTSPNQFQAIRETKNSQKRLRLLRQMANENELQGYTDEVERYFEKVEKKN